MTKYSRKTAPPHTARRSRRPLSHAWHSRTATLCSSATSTITPRKPTCKPLSSRTTQQASSARLIVACLCITTTQFRIHAFLPDQWRARCLCNTRSPGPCGQALHARGTLLATPTTRGHQHQSMPQGSARVHAVASTPAAALASLWRSRIRTGMPYPDGAC